MDDLVEKLREHMDWIMEDDGTEYCLTCKAADVIQNLQDEVSALEAAAQQAKRREDFCRDNTRPCPKCGTDQIQVITKPSCDFEWRCRHCKTVFS